jgi:hypothetical protein
MAMGRALLISIGIFILVALISAGAQAQNDQQPWCAYFTGGPTNCGFTTFAQCLEAIRGKTGLCQQNAQYIPPAQSNSGAGRQRRSTDR